MNAFVPFFTADPRYKEPVSVSRGTFESIWRRKKRNKTKKINGGAPRTDTMREKPKDFEPIERWRRKGGRRGEEPASNGSCGLNAASQVGADLSICAFSIRRDHKLLSTVITAVQRGPAEGGRPVRPHHVTPPRWRLPTRAAGGASEEGGESGGRVVYRRT